MSPVILKGKQILQKMCSDHLDWDSPLPDELRSEWEKWRRSLLQLEAFKVQRCFKPHDFGAVVKVELHHFSDASINDYGQCSYIRLVNEQNQTHCAFLMGKARVVPLKPTTVPRVELTAAVLSVKINMLLKNELEYTDITEYFWTDSQVVLGYINNEARRFHVYVASRVQQIRNATEPCQWQHVKGSENPADYASRGLNADELFNQPSWLSRPEFLWNAEIPNLNDPRDLTIHSNDPELRAHSLLVQKDKLPSYFEVQRLDYFSACSQAKRAIAHCLRLKDKLRAKSTSSPNQNPSKCKELGVQELNRAELEIIKVVHRHSFQDELNILRSLKTSLQKDEESGNKYLKRSSPLYHLDPFIDKDGILRVGGRLHRSNQSMQNKHPVVLPRKGHVTDLVIHHFHAKVEHQGRGITTNEIRANGFWILGCSSAVSSVIYKCVKCRKIRGKCQVQKMADLPVDRLEPSPPFSYCAVDYFGPWYIKEGRKTLKRYGALFTCMSLRAVHIEVANTLSTDQPFSLKGPHNEICVTLDPLGKNTA